MIKFRNIGHMKDDTFDEIVAALSDGVKVLETSDAFEVAYPEKGFGVRVSHSTLVIYSLLDESIYYATSPRPALIRRYLQSPPQWATEAPIVTSGCSVTAFTPRSTTNPTGIIRDCVHKGMPKADCMVILKEKCSDRSDKSLKTLVHSLYSTEGKRMRLAGK